MPEYEARKVPLIYYQNVYDGDSFLVLSALRLSSRGFDLRDTFSSLLEH